MSSDEETIGETTDDRPYWLRLHQKFVAPYLHKYLGSAIAVALGAATTLGVFYFLFVGYLDARDEVLREVKSSVSDYKVGTEKRLDILIQDNRIVSESISTVGRDISDIRERIARVEAQSETAATILLSASAPRIEREFLPILSRTPSVAMGGPDGGPDYDPVPGFDDMTTTIRLPRTYEERDAAITFLIRNHRRVASSQELTQPPEFRP